jgi:hypothetical protein
VDHDLVATLCSGQCVVADLEALSDTFTATVDRLSLRVAPGTRSEVAYPEPFVLTISGEWPFGELGPGNAISVKVVDRGDGRTLLDETFNDLEPSPWSPSYITCNNNAGIECEGWRGSSSGVLPRPCVPADCESVPTANLVTLLSRDALRSAPYDPEPSNSAPPLVVTACRKTGCDSFSIYLAGLDHDWFACPHLRQTPLGPFDCGMSVWDEHRVRLFVTARGNREWITDIQDTYSLTVVNTLTGETLAHHEEDVVYGLASPPDDQCVAEDGPFCTAVDIDWSGAAP